MGFIRWKIRTGKKRQQCIALLLPVILVFPQSHASLSALSWLDQSIPFPLIASDSAFPDSPFSLYLRCPSTSTEIHRSLHSPKRHPSSEVFLSLFFWFPPNLYLLRGSVTGKLGQQYPKTESWWKKEDLKALDFPKTAQILEQESGQLNWVSNPFSVENARLRRRAHFSRDFLVCYHMGWSLPLGLCPFGQHRILSLVHSLLDSRKLLEVPTGMSHTGSLGIHVSRWFTRELTNLACDSFNSKMFPQCMGTDVSSVTLVAENQVLSCESQYLPVELFELIRKLM